MNLQVELRRVSNWLVIKICHERYNFETFCHQYKLCSLQEVLDKENLPKEKIEKPREKYYPQDFYYNYDKCSKNNSSVKNSSLIEMNIEVVHIIDMADLEADGNVHFIWGKTNKKQGLFDTIEDEEQSSQDSKPRLRDWLSGRRTR